MGVQHFFYEFTRAVLSSLIRSYAYELATSAAVAHDHFLLIMG